MINIKISKFLVISPEKSIYTTLIQFQFQFHFQITLAYTFSTMHIPYNSFLNVFVYWGHLIHQEKNFHIYVPDTSSQITRQSGAA